MKKQKYIILDSGEVVDSSKYQNQITIVNDSVYGNQEGKWGFVGKCKKVLDSTSELIAAYNELAKMRNRETCVECKAMLEWLDKKVSD